MAPSSSSFFSKKNINEPALELNDPRWKELEGGYHGAIYDASVELKLLEQASTKKGADEIYKVLWDQLHHQGDVGIASYYSVPHLVRIAKINQFLDYNVFGLVSLIEIQRHKKNPVIPKALLPNYQAAIKELGELGKIALDLGWNTDLACSVLSAIALSKGQVKLADVILKLDDDLIAEFLEQY